jgi:hypothetical protein
MTTRQAKKLEIKLAQSALISHLAALGGKTKQLFSDNLSYQKMKISYQKTKTFFDKVRNCNESRTNLEATTDQLLTELLCRVQTFTETDAIRISSILNLIKNKTNEPYYISLPSSYVDERVKNANSALMTTAQLNIAGHTMVDTLSVLTDGTKKETDELTNLLIQTVVAGISTVSSIKFSGKVYKYFYDSLEPSERKDLSVLFSHMITNKPTAETSRVFKALASSPGSVTIESADIETILECTELVSSILSMPTEKEPTTDIKKVIPRLKKLATERSGKKQGLSKKLTTFFKNPFNKTKKNKPMADHSKSSEN